MALIEPGWLEEDLHDSRINRQLFLRRSLHIELIVGEPFSVTSCVFPAVTVIADVPQPDSGVGPKAFQRKKGIILEG